MKIAVIFPTFTGPYGAEKLLLNLSSELIKMKNEVTLFTPKYDNRCNVMLHPHLKIIETGCFNIKDWDLSKLLEHYSVAKIYKYLSDNFDVINIHNYPIPITAALTKKFKKIKVPVVYQCNEPPRFLYDLSAKTYKRFKLHKRIAGKILEYVLKKIDMWSINYVDEIITISKFMQNEIKKIYNRDSIFIMPGIETKNFNPNVDGSKIREKYAKNNDFIILTSNKLHPRKRVDMLIKATYYVIKKHKNIKVIITGDGIEREKLQNLIKELNVQDYIKVVGFISEEELPKYYAACDVFVFTAIREPQIGSPAEALASGKPVIAPNDGSPKETIMEGKTGFLYKPLDEKDLAKKIIWCIENRDYIKKMSKDCRKWVEENMAWEKMAKETLRVFKEAIKNA